MSNSVLSVSAAAVPTPGPARADASRIETEAERLFPQYVDRQYNLRIRANQLDVRKTSCLRLMRDVDVFGPRYDTITAQYNAIESLRYVILKQSEEATGLLNITSCILRSLHRTSRTERFERVWKVAAHGFDVGLKGADELLTQCNSTMDTYEQQVAAFKQAKAALDAPAPAAGSASSGKE